MFNKKSCKRCQEKVKDKFDFCPYCGYSFVKKEEDYGLLGKNDFMDNPFEELEKNIFGGFSGKILNKMLGSAMKMLEKEMKKNIAETKNNNIKTNFELYVNGKKISPEHIKITKKPIIIEESPKSKTASIHFDDNAQKKFAELPKKEPTTHLRRLANKVVYEMDVPGVESIKDISVIKLENSLEVRAIAKDKAYRKNIGIDLPLLRYKLNNEKLVLELKG